MKKRWVIFFLICFHTGIFAQRVNYKSVIYDGITYVPVEGANIYNCNTKQYVFSDSQGAFVIPVQANDTLIISKSIYRQQVVAVSAQDISLGIKEYYLFYKSILLKEVNVYYLNPSYEGFKREISHLKLPDAYRKIDGISISAEDKMNAEMLSKGPNVLRNTPLASPITALYNRFSSKVKMQKLYYEMMQYESEIEKVPHKYNKELVSDLTGLEGTPLMEFMVFCRFSYYDLIRWSETEIASAVKYKFNEYQYYKMTNTNVKDTKNE
ncbi:MAG: hypothetical protein LBR51_01005 [Bacteroidales bacterium]|jgi:hypothetical protein|nr:hypothetical protein [Bacteroidales bacterium]